MAERFKAQSWKDCVGETLPWVQIPLSPPDLGMPSWNQKKLIKLWIVLKMA